MSPSQHVALRTGSVLGLVARRSLGNEQGLALVMTLFVVALVTVLVLEYHFDASVELDLAANYANDVQAYHLALAGVRFADAMLRRDNPNADGPDDDWYKLGLVPACFPPQQLLELATIGVGASPDSAVAASPDTAGLAAQNDVGCVSLKITDEDSKLPLNALKPSTGSVNGAPPGLWGPIFQGFFDSFQLDSEVMEALLDWLDADDTPRGAGGAERSYYERLPVPYTPPEAGDMRTPGELRLVKGLDNPEELAKLFPGVAPEALADLDLGSNDYLTPFVPASPTAKVNLNTASKAVLMALFKGIPGISSAEAEVDELDTRRREGQFGNMSAAVPNSSIRGRLNPVAKVSSQYFRVESVGVVGIVHKKIVAVFKRPSPGAIPSSPSPSTSSNILYFKVE